MKSLVAFASSRSRLNAIAFGPACESEIPVIRAHGAQLSARVLSCSCHGALHSDGKLRGAQCRHIPSNLDMCSQSPVGIFTRCASERANDRQNLGLTDRTAAVRLPSERRAL